LFRICVGGYVRDGRALPVARLALNPPGAAFPHGTLAADLIGSFLFAALMYIDTARYGRDLIRVKRSGVCAF
jgi:fluoride ion exporter CrcB/FEX